jgi:hypothetical protein
MLPTGRGLETHARPRVGDPCSNRNEYQGYLVRKADNLATFMCQLSRNPGSLNFLEPKGPVQTCIGIVLPIHLLVFKILDFILL